MGDRYAAALTRLAAYIDDPFDGLVLRDLVPRGQSVSVALPDDRCETVARRAMGQAPPGATIAYVALIEGEDVTIIAITDNGERDPANPRRRMMRITLPLAMPLRDEDPEPASPDEPIGRAVARLRDR